jgi:hypothetical protein
MRTGQFLRATVRIVGIPVMLGAIPVAAASLEHLTDLTDKTNIIVTLKGRDNFTSEYRYDVSVRNLLPDPLIADSLIIVLDRITNLAGEDRENLQGEPLVNRFEIVGQDGETDDGKPYYRVPAGASPDLLPRAESRPATVRMRNRDYVVVFSPVFRVYGARRPPPEPKLPATPTQPPAARPQPSERQMEKLIQLLLKKGVITEEEWRKALQP